MFLLEYKRLKKRREEWNQLKELRIDALTKTYGEKTLFDQLSFLIHEKDHIGLIGINGTGKSSLLKLLAKEDTPDSGVITGPHDYQIRYLAQDTVFDENLTVAQAVFSGDSPILLAVRNYELALQRLADDGEDTTAQQAYTKAEERMNREDAWLADTNVRTILNQLGIPDISQKIGELSGGQKKRVGLAQVLIQEPDLLLLDEPTNHLDYQAIKWLESFLNQYQGAFVLVTHDRYFLDNVTNRMFELSFGKLYQYKGNYENYLIEKAQREETEKQQETKRKQLYKQELSWMRAGVKARGTKQQARIQRFEDLKENLHQVQTSEHVEIDIATKRLGKKVLKLEQATFTLDQQIILKNFELLVQTHDRIGITGKNGSGKSTLLNILAGRIELEAGVYEIGETVRIGYYTQQNEAIDPNKRMIQYLQEAAEQVEQTNGSTTSVAEMLERFLFPRFMHGTTIGKLSGGEKRRLFLLKLLILQPNVLLLDEPTNDLDIDTLTILEDYLSQFAGAVIGVSHDRYFLDKTMERLFIFEGNGEIEYFYGSMTDYLAKKEDTQKNLATKKHSDSQNQTTEIAVEKVKKKLTYAEQKEWEAIEDQMELLEVKIEELKAEMNISGSDFAKLQELQQQVEAKELKLEDMLNRWEYLSQFTS